MLILLKPTLYRKASLTHGKKEAGLVHSLGKEEEAYAQMQDEQG